MITYNIIIPQTALPRKGNTLFCENFSRQVSKVSAAMVPCDGPFPPSAALAAETSAQQYMRAEFPLSSQFPHYPQNAQKLPVKKINFLQFFVSFFKKTLAKPEKMLYNIRA